LTSGFRRRAAVLALAAAAYAVAAWAVAPGFYDGIAPPQPYRWVCPPPQFVNNNQAPQNGHGTVRVVSNGIVDPGSVFSQDGQAAISFVAGAFVTPADHSPVSIDIKTQAGCVPDGAVHIATNVYCISGSSPLAPGKDVLVTLQYSGSLPAPSDVYEEQPGGQWRKLGSTGSAAPYYIAVRSTELGCYAGGYPANARQTTQGATVGGGQTLPIVVALAILVVVLAGIPLAVMRRRGAADDEEDEDR